MKCSLPRSSMKTLSVIFLLTMLLSPSMLFAAEENTLRQPIRVQGMDTLYAPQNSITDRGSVEYGRPLTGNLKGPSRNRTGGRPSVRSIDKQSKGWKNDVRSGRENRFEDLGIPQRRNRSRFKRESAYQKKSSTPSTEE